jgi:hypothetical protein
MVYVECKGHAMSDQLAALLLRELQALVATMSPWISTPEMMARYDCTAQTLGKMERRCEIPWRVSGRWNRAEVIEWESKLLAGSPQ